MNREQAKVWAKLSRSELQTLGLWGLAKWYEVLTHFANDGDIQRRVGGEWRITLDPFFGDTTDFRIKTKTHIVNGFEVPAPIKEYTGQRLICVPSFAADDLVESFYATRKLIKRRAAFETKEAARANALAMLGIDPSTYEGEYYDNSTN